MSVYARPIFALAVGILSVVLYMLWKYRDSTNAQAFRTAALLGFALACVIVLALTNATFDDVASGHDGLVFLAFGSAQLALCIYFVVRRPLPMALASTGLQF